MSRIHQRSPWMAAGWTIIPFFLGILMTTGFSVNRSKGPMNQEFNQLQSDLKSANRILAAQLDRVVFLDRNNQRKEYAFFGTTLWRNDHPVASNIQAFHFEYRDHGGNLMKMSDIRLSSIRSVAYILRAKSGSLFTNTAVRVQPVAVRDSKPAQVSWASLTED